MDSFKTRCENLLQSSRNPPSPNLHYFSTLLLILLLFLLIFFFYASDDTSPSISYSPLSNPSPLSTVHFDFASENYRSCTDAAALPPAHHHSSRNGTGFGFLEGKIESCDLFDGRWVFDERFRPNFEPDSCPFVDDAFNCFKNGRLDSDYLKYKWKPHHCEIPRFDGLEMLKMLKGKRMVFVGDSLNRNMWESLVCSLRESLDDKRRVFEASGRRQFRSQGFYSFKFKDFNCSIDFFKSPFLVQESRFFDKTGTQRERLRLDMIEGSYHKYQDADIIIFNTGHWWTHQKTFKGSHYFQEGNHVYNRLEVKNAYKKALKTWAHWIDSNINSTRTRIFFCGYSSSHFKGGRWNSGGNCNGETKPITNETQLGLYPWMMRALESVLSEMKTPVYYLNITRMTDYRKEGHPSIFRHPASKRKPGMIQDCSHWCLPGIPDSWNELLYAILTISP